MVCDEAGQSDLDVWELVGSSGDNGNVLTICHSSSRLAQACFHGGGHRIFKTSKKRASSKYANTFKSLFVSLLLLSH